MAAAARPRSTSADTANASTGLGGGSGTAAGAATVAGAGAPATAAAGCGWAIVDPAASVVTTAREDDCAGSGTGVGTPGAMSAVARDDCSASSPPLIPVSAT